MRPRWLLLLVLAACESTTGMEVGGGADAAAGGGDAALVPPDGGAGAGGAAPASPDTAPPTGPDAAPATTCAFDRSYEFFRDGGLRIYQDRSRLTPPRQHLITRDRRGGAAPVTCTRTLPCDRVTAITGTLAHPDVVEAMQQPRPPHHGSDPRPVDGTIFVFTRDDGRGFSVGPGNVPAGVRALEQLLLAVEQDSLAAPECAALQ